MSQASRKLFGPIRDAYTFEDCETALTSLGETYCTEEVHYTLVFPDTEEHRLTMGRFLMGDDFHAVPRQTMVQGFDPSMHAGQISHADHPQALYGTALSAGERVHCEQRCTAGSTPS